MKRGQPVHTVYGGAHLFRAGTARRLGELALETLRRWAPDASALDRALDLPRDETSEGIYARIVEKLEREPVEDFRIDFEDGYGNRPDGEEDGHVRAAAEQWARGAAEGSLPPFTGIRIKPLGGELEARALRTLDRFVEEAARTLDGGWPGGFVVTLPKVTATDQVERLVEALDALEARCGLDPGTLALELMIETPESIFAADGRVAPARLVAAAAGRCRGAHFGTYDYTASCGISAEHQHMTHPACDFARHVMQVSLVSTGVWLSDGATNVLPVEPRRPGEGREPTSQDRAVNREAVHGAWRLHYRHVMHSLAHGYYQGWDLHPAQLPTRYAAVYRFFLQDFESAAARLANFVDRAAQATLVGAVFDDAATGQGLLNYFLRAIECGAVPEERVLTATGLSLDELRGRSFVRILEARRGD